MPYRPKSDFLRVMIERGYVADCTDYAGLDGALLEGPVTAYIGYDATAASLHVGHLLNIMMLRWFQKTGNRPITLMGGGTTKVGDPSFRSEERPLLDDAAIQSNLRETTTRVLASLTPREERVLRMRFGIGMNTDHTLEEVGQQFSVTRERIRQIEAKALRKLKHPSRSRKMRSFLDQ